MWFKVMVCGPVCGVGKREKLEKIRKRGRLEAKVEETKKAVVPPPTFLALDVGLCVLFKSPH